VPQKFRCLRSNTRRNTNKHKGNITSRAGYGDVGGERCVQSFGGETCGKEATSKKWAWIRRLKKYYNTGYVRIK